MTLNKNIKTLKRELREAEEIINQIKFSSFQEIEDFIFDHNLPISAFYWDIANFISPKEYLEFNRESFLREFLIDYGTPFSCLKHSFKLSDEPSYYSTINVIIYPREEDRLIHYIRQVKIKRINNLLEKSKSA